MKPRTLLAALLAALTVLPVASASAHVTVVPRTAAAGSYTVFDVRVPNERDDAATVKVDLKLPDGFITASYEPIPGWQARVLSEQLRRPIETENGPISEQISRVVWTSTGDGIPPGAFQDFPLSVKLPDEQGTTLSFKALQTYRGGDVVRWIGAPDSELPAATVELTAAADGEGDGAGAGHSGGEDADEQPAVTTPAGEATAAAQPAASDDDDGASKGLAYAGLGAGIVGLLLGAAALTVASRRRDPAPTPPAPPPASTPPATAPPSSTDPQ